jgi:hypothetical protein
MLSIDGISSLLHCLSASRCAGFAPGDLDERNSFSVTAFCYLHAANLLHWLCGCLAGLASRDLDKDAAANCTV